MGIKCLQTIFEIRGPELNQTEVLGNSDTLSLLKMGKLVFLNSFNACGDFCRLLIAFANSLDPDQDRLFDTLIVFLKEFFEKKINFEKSCGILILFLKEINFEKISRQQKKS